MSVGLKFILLACLSSLFSISINAQIHSNQTMAEKANLKGRVKSVNTFGNGLFSKDYYEKNGQLTKRETRYKLYYNYMYNSQGKPISYNALVLSSGHVDYYHLTYDKRGFLVSDGYDTHKNDERGNCIEEIRSYGTIKRKYNTKNQVVEEWMYYGENHIIHSFGVDENGNHWEEDELMPPEGEHILFTYNSSGDIIQLRTENTQTPQVNNITYKYDEKGNWIEQHNSAYIFNSNIGNYERITGELITRTIEYYD